MTTPDETAGGGTWIGPTTDGVVVARLRKGELLVDRPALGRFRDRRPALAMGETPVVDGVKLAPVAPLLSDMSERSGWYDGADRTVLLTQIPESYFGEPMILLAEGDRVVRAYPLDETNLLDEDGRTVELVAGGVRLGGETLARTTRYTEREVSFVAGGVELAGTVILPPGEGPHPAAVLLHGAAGGQRDWCRLHAAPILTAGVAVLLYDKAGHGESGGTEPSVFDQADAGEAAMEALAAVPGVDPARIGLAGFSNGMWAVPIIAARRGVAFVAGVGSPGVSMAEAEVHRRVKVLRECGVAPSTLDAVADAWRCIFTIVADGPTDPVTASLERALQALTAAGDLDRYEIPDYVRENPMLSPIPPPIPPTDLVQMLASERDPQVGHDPAADYRRITCPILLQYGADDTSVPVEASVIAVRAAAPHADLRVYPGLEHMLNVLPSEVTGLSPEGVMYQYHHFRYGAGVWAELTNWLRTTMRSR
ncbi:MAG: alpha/beta hydrolase family protein [Sciscionella sp.]